MSRLKELIEQLCPDGVEYRPFGDVIKRERAKGKSRPDVTKVYSVTNEYGVIASDDYRINQVASADTSNYTVISPGMFAYNPSRIDVGSIGKLADDAEDGLVSPLYVVFSVIDNALDLEFVELFISSSYVHHRVVARREAGARNRFEFSYWDEVMIPVPPIDVQHEIVSILDAMQMLNDTLDEELKAREKQLVCIIELIQSHLKEKEHGVQLVNLKEVCSIIKAGGDVPPDCVKGQSQPDDIRPYPVYSNGTGESALYGYAPTYVIGEKAVTIAGRGVNCGYHVVREGKFTPIVRLVTLVPDERVTAEYLDFALESCDLQSSKAGVPQLTVPMVKSNDVLIPSIEEQNSITEKIEIERKLIKAIAKELHFRRSQFKYYRDKLLNLPKKDVVA